MVLNDTTTIITENNLVMRTIFTTGNNASFDTVPISLEHSPIDILTTSMIVVSAGLAVIVILALLMHAKDHLQSLRVKSRLRRKQSNSHINQDYKDSSDFSVMSDDIVRESNRASFTDTGNPRKSNSWPCGIGKITRGFISNNTTGNANNSVKCDKYTACAVDDPDYDVFVKPFRYRSTLGANRPAIVEYTRESTESSDEDTSELSGLITV